MSIDTSAARLDWFLRTIFVGSKDIYNGHLMRALAPFWGGWFASLWMRTMFDAKISFVSIASSHGVLQLLGWSSGEAS